MTPVGYIFALVALWALSLRPCALFWLAVVAAVFEGGAVLNYTTAGGTTIPAMPFYFVCVVAAAALVWRAPAMRARWRKLPAEPRRVATWLAVFATWGVISAFALPRFFAGMLVNSPRVGMDLTYGHLVPLQFGHSNLAQAGYVPLAFLFLVFALCCQPPAAAGRTADRGLVAATGIALAVGFYQKAAAAAGWYFPARLIISNLVTFRTGAYHQVISGLGLRLSSTFSEPSYAGAFFPAAFVFFSALALSSRRNRVGRSVLAFACLVASVLTGSSTAFACLAVGVGLLAAAEMVAPLLRGDASPVRIVVGAAATIAAAVAAAVEWPLLARVVDAEVLEKIYTGSAMHRFAADRSAWAVFWHSWGLGVGLGSERPSSLALYLLSNVGVFGSVVFAGALVAMWLACRRRRRAARDPEARGRLAALQYAFLVNLAALAISIPDISWPMLWVWWAMLLVELASPVGLFRSDGRNRGDSRAYPGGSLESAMAPAAGGGFG